MDPARNYILPMVGILPTTPQVGAYLPAGMGAYLPQSGVGYLGPGATVGDYDLDTGEDFPSRLNPDDRL
jgi:hypothetical protein